MSIIVSMRSGEALTEVRAQRINTDPLIEANFLIEGVTGIEMRLVNGDALLPHTMSVPKVTVVAYYGGEVVSQEAVIEAASDHLKALSLKKTEEAAQRKEWPGIEGTSYSA